MTKNVTTEDVDNILLDLLNDAKAPLPDDPRSFSALAARSQVSLAVLTGYQVKATIRLADAAEKVGAELKKFAASFEEGGDSNNDLLFALEGIRKAITSNG